MPSPLTRLTLGAECDSFTNVLCGFRSVDTCAKCDDLRDGAFLAAVATWLHQKVGPEKTVRERLTSPATSQGLRFPFTSAERRLLKRTKLARMERLAALFQELDGGQPDLEMLGNGRLVKGIRRARQLDLAM
jgi:hypothetical protein